jgi:tRNA dimethylallyltransferase
LICIVGPTAIGKTSISIRLAKAFNTEIISCDSRQFYREMKIGTAVPSDDELAQVKHHFIQHLSIFENYSVGNYEKEALNKINEIFETKNTLCLTGGSGFQSLINPLEKNLKPPIKMKASSPYKTN